MSDERSLVLSSVQNLERWIEDHHYRGYDPADGLTSYLRALTFGNLLLDRLLQQLIWRFPWNLRPLLGVQPRDSYIGRGFIVRAYLTLYKITGEDSYVRKASESLDWLARNRAPGYKHFGWGKMFDFASRSGRQKKHEPITVWTSLIGQAFLDAYETTGEPRYLGIAESICEWILDVPRTVTRSGSCINYTPLGRGRDTIHNQSMLAAAMLVRTAQYSRKRDYLETARSAVEYTCTRQRPDGSWYYGEDDKHRWIDSFHTGYVLDALGMFIDLTGDARYQHSLDLGLAFFKEHFFRTDGMPKYYHNRTYPIDSQCAAQAIDTLTRFADRDPASLDLAKRVARWTIIHMQDPSGYFYFMRYPCCVLKTPMIHWAQAVTFRAMAQLLCKI